MLCECCTVILGVFTNAARTGAAAASPPPLELRIIIGPDVSTALYRGRGHHSGRNQPGEARTKCSLKMNKRQLKKEQKAVKKSCSHLRDG